MKNLILASILGLSLLGCQKAPEEPSGPKIDAYFSAIKRNFSNIEKVCYDYKSETFFAKISQIDDDQKQFWGWNAISPFEFKALGNGTVVLMKSSWTNTEVDTTGLSCDH